MARLTRVQQQERTRAAVLAAARQEFTEYGYEAAKVDRIADRADLTRGAVYSNFPGKRALYLAVLVETLEPGTGPATAPATVAEALGSFARVWLERLPLTGDSAASGHLRLRSLTGVLDEPGRRVLTQLTMLEATLLGQALEAHPPRAPRRVRLAELALTLLHGSASLAQNAPGFGDTFDVALACGQLAGIALTDVWEPPHLPFVAPARPADAAWNPPAGAVDLLTGRPADLGRDGVIAVLGAGRLGAAEEAVRAAGPHDQVTVVAVTGDPAETGRLIRLRIGDVGACLAQAFAATARPSLRVVLDEGAAIATALGLPAPADEMEEAVRIRDGRIVARAEGRGAAHAAAAVGVAS